MNAQSIPMTRARLYVLIDAFERDMRALLARFISVEVSDNVLLGNLYEKASKRRVDDDAVSGETPLSEYLDLREAYDLLNRHRSFLPEELAREIRECTPTMDRLVGIRRRVMHSRPLLADDSDAAPMILNQFSTAHWSETRRILSQLDQDPSWEPLVLLDGNDSAILHNLPLPDYDETGLIGRSAEVESLVGMVKRGRESVITVTGEGGIGKTALALDAAYSIVDDPEAPFEAVLWTSLKHERLTAQGVKEIANAARDITNAAKPLGQAIDSSFQGNLEDLAEGLRGLNVLVVLDNLETIGGLDFTQLYEALPDTVQFLVTSRIGVGEYERRFPLLPLDEKSSLRLLNNFIRARRLEGLDRISSETRKEVVERLRYSPLAIRWFVLAVEAGRDPVGLIRDQSELLEFCVRSVYESLTAPAREVLSALAVLARPVTADELVLLLDKSADSVNVGLQELIRGALIRRDTSGSSGELALRVRLTETAGQFLDKRIVVDREFSKLVAAREAEYRANEERRLADTSLRSLAPVVIRTEGPHDVPTAQILRKALLASQENDTDQALAHIETAHRLNPDFWEVDRVEAFILASVGQNVRALECYEVAYSKARGEGRAVVAHFMAGFLARTMREIPRAIEYAREAHSLLATGDTAVALGNYLVWNREFEEGIGLIEPTVVAADGKSKLIAVSSLAQAYKRWGEHAGEHGRNPVLQFRRASKGMEIALASLDAGVADTRIREIATDSASMALKGAAAAASDRIPVPELGAHLERLGKSLVRLVGTPSWVHLKSAVARLLKASRGAAAVQRLARQMADLDEGQVAAGGESSSRYSGEIVSLREVYGFIRHPSFPKNLFFHRDDLAAGEEFGDLRSGALLSFVVRDTDRGPRAAEISAL